MDVSTLTIKHLPRPEMTVCATFKVSNVKIFHDYVTSKTRSRSNLWHAVKGFVLMDLGYSYQVCTLNGYWFMDICLSHWLKCKISTFTHKIQKQGCNDLILGMPCSIYFRCSQVWHGTCRPSGLNFMPSQVKSHWFPLKMSITGVTLTEIKLIWFLYVG